MCAVVDRLEEKEGNKEDGEGGGEETRRNKKKQPFGTSKPENAFWGPLSNGVGGVEL